MTEPNDRHDELGSGRNGREVTRPNGPHPSDELLNGYVDGALVPAERAAVDAHIAGCAACRARVAEFRGLVALLAGLPEPRARRSFQLAPTQIAPPTSRWQRFGTRLIPATPAFRAAAAAAAIVLLLVAATLGRSLLDNGSDHPNSTAPAISMNVADTPTAPTSETSRNTATLPPNQQSTAGYATTKSPILATLQPANAIPAATSVQSEAGGNAAGTTSQAKAVPTPTPATMAKTSGAGAANAVPAAGAAPAEIGSTEIAGATTGGGETETSEVDSYAGTSAEPTAEAGVANSVMAASEPSTADSSVAAEAAAEPPIAGDQAITAQLADAGPTAAPSSSRAATIAPKAVATETGSPVASPVSSPVASPIASPPTR